MSERYEITTGKPTASSVWKYCGEGWLNAESEPMVSLVMIIMNCNSYRLRNSVAARLVLSLA